MNPKEIPPGWNFLEMREVITLISEKWEPEFNTHELVNYIGLENIESQSGKMINFKPSLPSKIKSSKNIFSHKDVLYGKLRPYLNKVLLPPFNGICSTDIIVLRPKHDVIREYLAYFLRSNYVLLNISSMTYGTKMPRTKIQDLEKIKIPLPSLNIQRKIVHRIDYLFSVLEEKKQTYSTLNDTIDKELKILPVRTKQFLIDNTILRNNNPSWKLCKLDDICSKITDGAHKTPTYVDDGIPFLRVKDIHDDYIDWSKTKKIPTGEHQELIRRCKPELGDVLFSKNGTIGISKVVDWKDAFSIFVSLALLKPKIEILDSYFLKHCLDSNDTVKQIRKRSKTATVTNLHLEEIREVEIPVPSLPQQKIIVHKINKELAKLMQIKLRITTLMEYRSKVQTYFENLNNVILDQAVVGKLLS